MGRDDVWMDDASKIRRGESVKLIADVINCLFVCMHDLDGEDEM